MTTKKLSIFTFLLLVTMLAISSYRSRKLDESISSLTIDTYTGEPTEINKESLEQLNNIYIEDDKAEEVVALTDNEAENFEVQYCIEGDSTEKEADLIQLNELENELFVEEDISADETELIRAKILAIKTTYKLPLEYTDRLRMEDFMLLQMTDYTEEEYSSLTDEKKKALIISYGGTQYLRDAYIKSEIQGRQVASPTEEQLELRDKETDLHSLLEHENGF